MGLHFIQVTFEVLNTITKYKTAIWPRSFNEKLDNAILWTRCYLADKCSENRPPCMYSIKFIWWKMLSILWTTESWWINVKYVYIYLDIDKHLLTSSTDGLSSWKVSPISTENELWKVPLPIWYFSSGSIYWGSSANGKSTVHFKRAILRKS